MVFPSNAHPGKVVEGGGREGDGRNGRSKSSDRPIREGGGGGLTQCGGRGERGKMESPRRGGVGGARVCLAKLR
uniref:Uncharacterized protein n=1 Tax=Oryza glumipatula TaxID=40148 RepID=A0A0D9Y8T2_9ORYZ